MSTKRLLFIQDDPLLGSIYRDRLENAGFAVETARNSESGLRLMAELRPDAVVLDPVLSSGDIGESITHMRAQSHGAAVPIIVLFTSHRPLSASAERAGATHVLERSDDPIGALVAELSKALGMGPDAESISGAGMVESYWHKATLSAGPASLMAMRQALHEVIRTPQNPETWRDLFNKAHAYAGQVNLIASSAVAHVATALEVLIYGLVSMPERANASALRTIGQTIDFMAELWSKDAHLVPVDLSPFHVVVIEDDQNAREMICTAMDLVGLNADGMETPTACVAVLSTQPCDLILLDVNLPEMNGFEACTQIRTLPLHEKTPVVFLTGMVTFQNRVQSSLSGGNDFIAKPFNIAELGLKALIWLFKSRMANAGTDGFTSSP